MVTPVAPRTVNDVSYALRTTVNDVSYVHRFFARQQLSNSL